MREGEHVLLGSDLDALSDPDLAEAVITTAVYARVTASHKLRIVGAWRNRHETVAMTGDGITMRQPLRLPTLVSRWESQAPM